jgi:hypothetical protein
MRLVVRDDQRRAGYQVVHGGGRGHAGNCGDDERSSELTSKIHIYRGR